MPNSHAFKYGLSVKNTLGFLIEISIIGTFIYAQKIRLKSIFFSSKNYLNNVRDTNRAVFRLVDIERKWTLLLLNEG